MSENEVQIPTRVRVSPNTSTSSTKSESDISFDTTIMDLAFEKMDLTPIEISDIMKSCPSESLVNEDNTKNETDDDIKAINSISVNNKEMMGAQSTIYSTPEPKGDKRKDANVISKEQAIAIMESVIYRCAAPANIKDVPMFLAMTKINVTFTGSMRQRVKTSLGSMIEQMNGRVHINYSENTNFMVSTKGLTEKVIFARNKKIPVMTPDWVHSVWNAVQTDPYVHGSDTKFTEQHALPLFFNANICIPSIGVSQEQRTILQKLIMEHGGRTIDKLTEKCGDLLIYEQSENIISRDYNDAMALGVPVVTPAWITICVLDMTLVDFGAFEVKRCVKKEKTDINN